MKLYLLPFFLLFQLLSYSQNNEKEIASSELKPNIFKVHLYNLDVNGNTSLIFGYERFVSEKYSLEITAGKLFSSLFSEEDGKKTDDFKIAIEGKFYHKKSWAFKYHSLELNYFKYNILKNQIVYYDEQDENGNTIRKSRENNYFIDNKITTLNYKWGFQFLRSRNIAIDGFIGVGVKYKNSKEKGKVKTNLDVNEDITVGDFFFNDEEQVGKYFLLSVPIGVKIGYNF